ncbi:MAG: hypothetical protein U0836_11295 [Pirellulales bacterium]
MLLPLRANAVEASYAAAIDGSGKKVVGYTDVQPASWIVDGSHSQSPHILQDDYPLWGAANGISRDGEVIVGWNAPNAFRWTESGGMENLGPGEAFAVSNDGMTVVGDYFDEHHLRSRAMRWTPAGKTDLGEGAARAVSADGQVTVGWDGHNHATLWEDGLTKVLWSPGIAQDISADGSIVVGGNMLWTRAGGAKPLGPELLTLSAVTDDGSLIVGSQIGGAIEWRPSRGVQDLATVLVRDYGLGNQLGELDLEYATDVSPTGNAIVGYSGNSIPWVVQLVDPLLGDANFDDRVDLNDFGILKAHIGSGHWRDEGDFNRDLRVDLTDVGVLKDNFGRVAGVTTVVEPVPEPAGLLLATLAAALLGLARLRLVRR